MKTTKRSKMLLSSIAMLLVALVALGSASFAWYYNQNTVTASTTQFNAKAADGLVLSHDGGTTWAPTITDLATAASGLTPASIDYGSWSTVKAATGTGTSFTDGTLSGGLTGVDIQSSTASDWNSYFLKDSFKVASTGSALTDVTFTVNCTNIPANTYLNLAIYIGGTLETVLTSDQTANYDSTKKIKYASNAYSTDTDTQSLTQMAATVTIKNADMSVATKGAGGTDVQIIGFADGYNPRCTSEKANVGELRCTYTFSTT